MVYLYDPEFEEWAKSVGFDITKGDLKKDYNRPYRSHFTTHANHAWKAGIAWLIRKQMGKH